MNNIEKRGRSYAFQTVEIFEKLSKAEIAKTTKSIEI